MLIKRQNPQETTAKAPDNILPSRYGEIASDINGQIYCRDKKGKFQSLCSTAGYAENAGSATNASTASYSLLAKRVAGLPSVGTDVPENAVFTDHTYSFSTGTTNGSFLVNWSIAGQSYNNKGNYEVPITGLGSAAYKNSSLSHLVLHLILFQPVHYKIMLKKLILILLLIMQMQYLLAVPLYEIY